MNSWASDEEDDDLDDMVAMMVTTGQLPGFGRTSAEEAPLERKLPDRNKDRNFTAAKQCFDRFYFNDDKVYSEDDFERRFCMSRALFARLEADMKGKEEFKERRDVTGKPGIHPRIKIITALRVLEYGMSYEQVDELCELSESSTRKAFYLFLEQCIAV